MEESKWIGKAGGCYGVQDIHHRTCNMAQRITMLQTSFSGCAINENVVL